MKLHRIVAITTEQNVKALGLLHRLGFSKSNDLGEDDVEYELTPQGLVGVTDAGMRK